MFGVFDFVPLLLNASCGMNETMLSGPVPTQITKTARYVAFEGIQFIGNCYYHRHFMDYIDCFIVVIVIFKIICMMKFIEIKIRIRTRIVVVYCCL